jgi:predicted ATP-grasp superfamily ATP-dependent carboligase
MGVTEQGIGDEAFSMTRDQPPAIVIGGGSANGLGIGWNLGPRNIPVYCVTSDPNELLCASRYCHGYTILPHVEARPARLARWLRQMQPRFPEGGVLFPTTDTAVLTVATLRENLAPYSTYLPTLEAVETCVIKSQFYRSVAEYGIPHPRTLNPEERSVHEIAQQLTFPVFIRPAQTLLFNVHFAGKGFLARNVRELKRYLTLTRSRGVEVMVQEIIPGSVTNGYTFRGYLDRHSQPQVLYATHKLRQPSTFSNNTAWVTIPVAAVADFGNEILAYLRHIRYTGLFGAEFKHDPRDGTWKLLEVNARCMGGNYLGVACGANHVLAAYRDSLGDALPPPRPYQAGLYYLNDLQDLSTFVKLGVRRQLSTQDIWSFVGPKLWQQWSPADPLAFVRHLRNTLRETWMQHR